MPDYREGFGFRRVRVERAKKVFEAKACVTQEALHKRERGAYVARQRARGGSLPATMTQNFAGFLAKFWGSGDGRGVAGGFFPDTPGEPTDINDDICEQRELSAFMSVGGTCPRPSCAQD